MAISTLGVGSGLDINSLVTQIVSAEAQPANDRMNRNEASLQAKLSAVGSFKSALSDFSSAVAALADPAKFRGMTAAVGDSSLFTASATRSATAANYTVEVQKLAKAQSLALNDADRVADKTADVTDANGSGGKLGIKFGTYQQDGTFSANSEHSGGEVQIAAGASLEDIRTAINSAKLGVTANIMQTSGGYQLTLSSAYTGVANSLQITQGAGGDPALSRFAYDLSTGGVSNMRSTQDAQNAEAMINGLTATSATNTISDAIDGVTLTLKAIKANASDSTTTLDISRDTASVTSAVQSFVAAYNKFQSTTKSLTAYNPTTKAAGPLLGDVGVQAVNAQLQRFLGNSSGGSADYSLSKLGVAVQRDGTLKLDSSKLTDALKTDPEGVAKFFAGTEETDTLAATDGLADQIDRYLDKILDSKGPLTSRTDSINKRITDISDQRVALNRRLQALDARYRAQFTAMDTLISQLKATGSFLTQQLAGMSNIYNS